MKKSFHPNSLCWLVAAVGIPLSAWAGNDSWIGNASPNWANTNNWSPLSTTGPVANDQLFFAFTGSSGSLLTNDYAAGTIFNGITFQSSGSAFTIIGNAIGLNGGITNAGTSSQVISNSLTLKGNETIAATTGNITLAGVITDGGSGYGITKIGTGTNILTAVNTYSGVTAINGGTLRVTTTGALPSGSIVNLHNAAAATLDIQGLVQSLGGLVITNLGSATDYITGTAGSVLNLSVTPLTISPFGTTNSLTLNMAGLTGFNYYNTAGAFSVNNGASLASASTGVAILTLAGGTNSITASTVSIGTSSPSGGVISSTVNLGTNNTLDVGTITLGSGRVGGVLQFAAGTTGGLLAIAGTTGGTSAAILTVGNSHDSYQASDHPTDLADFTAGTLTAQFSSVTLGKVSPSSNITASRGITTTSSLKIGAGTLTAATMTLGSINTASGDTGSFTYSITNVNLFSITNGGVANVTNLILTSSSYPGALKAGSLLSSTINLTNGAVLNTTNIQPGTITTPASGSWVVIPQITWGDGSINNIASGNLAIGSVNIILYNAANAHTFNISAGHQGTVNSTITGTGTLTVAGAGTMTLNGSDTITGSLVQNSTNILTLAGANTFSGSLAISNGMVVLGGSASLSVPVINLSSNTLLDVSALGTYTLNSGQSVIGNGSINGSIMGNAGAQLLPGGAGTIGTLTFSNNLTLNGATTTFDLSPDPAVGNDVINVGGSVTLTANSTINVNELGALSPGTYTLMNYASLNTNSFNLIVVAPRNAVVTIGATSITLVVSGVASANLVWVGDGSANNWDVQTTTNWSNAGNPDAYYQVDSVSFTDTGSASPAVNLATMLVPGSVSVNAAQNYTFSSSVGGQLAGSMTLTKNGAGTLFLQTSNTYSGGTLVTNGTVEVDVAAAAGTGPISLASAGSLNFNAGGTLANVVNGSGTINVTELSGINSIFGGSLSNFTGVLNLPASPGGVAKGEMTGATVGINSNATINIANGGTLYVTGSGLTIAGTNNVSGDGNSENLGAIRVEGGAIISGPVNLLGNTAIGENSSGSGTISGVISDGGNGYGITKIGGNTSTLILTGPNTYSGGTTISNGTVQIGNSAVVGTLPGNVLLASNTANISFAVPTNQTATYNGVVSGLGSLEVNNIGGTLFLNGANTFTNSVNVNAGALWITNVAALGTGPKNIILDNGTAGHPELHLNGTNGNILVPATFGWLLSWVGGGSSPGVLINEAGTNEIDGTITLASGGGGSAIIVNGGSLDLTGAIAPSTTLRPLYFGGAGNGLVTGPITDGSGANTLTVVTKQGAGTWTFAGANTYVSNTLVSAGTLLVNGSLTGPGSVTVQANAILGGGGSIAGPVTVQANGTLAPGTNGISTLTLGGNLALNGNLYVKLNNSLAQSNDMVAVSGTPSCNGAGTVTLTNLGPALVAGNTFKVFSQAIPGAGTLTLQPASPGTGLSWTNNLAVDGTIGVVASLSTSPVTLTAVQSANSLTLSWPADHTGWRLLVQTANLANGVSSNTNDWTTVSGSTGVDTVTITLDPTKPAEFYRLVYP